MDKISTAFLSLLLLAFIFQGCATSPSVDRMPVLELEVAQFENARLPFLYTDSAGQTFLSYAVTSDSVSKMYFSKLEGSAWSEPLMVSSGNNWFVNWADYPSLISWGDGKLAAHWLEKTGSDTFAYQVKVSRSADGGDTWTVPVTLHSDTIPREHGFVSLVPFPSGRLFASWLDGRGYTVAGEHADHDPANEMMLMGGYVAEDGTIEGEEVLDARVCDCCQTASVLSDHGLVTFYRDRSEEEIRDVTEVRWSENGWREPKALGEDAWKIAGCPVNGPQADAIEEQVAVVWFTAGNDDPRVQLSLSGDAGAHPSVPIKVNHKSAIGRADVALISKDLVAVSWIEVEETKGVLKIAIFTIDGQRIEEWNVTEIATERSSGFPQLSSDGSRLIVAWTTETGIKSSIIQLTVI